MELPSGPFPDPLRSCSNMSSCTQAVKAAKVAQMAQPTAGQRQPAPVFQMGRKPENVEKMEENWTFLGYAGIGKPGRSEIVIFFGGTLVKLRENWGHYAGKSWYFKEKAWEQKRHTTPLSSTWFSQSRPCSQRCNVDSTSQHQIWTNFETHMVGKLSVAPHISSFSPHISSGWWFQPLWKIWVRQLGWLFPIYGKS